MTAVDHPTRLVSPHTGEVLTLDAPTDELAAYLAELREFESALREMKRVVTREVIARLDKAASWTLHVEGGLKLSAQSPAPSEEFDELALREELLKLVDEGVIDPAAVDAAVEPVVTYKARKRGINALRALGGRVRAVVDTHAREVERERYVTVTRA